MFSRKQSRPKRAWCDIRDPETPVPHSVDGLLKAKDAIAKSGAFCFDAQDLYDVVRDTVSERVLACPATDVSSDVASMCAMARDVCSKPVAILGHRRLPALIARLQANGIVPGTCDFGRRAELVDDLDEAVQGWIERDVCGVILFVIGTQAIVKPERARTVIRVTKEVSHFPELPLIYSPPRLWRVSKENLVHTGPRATIVAALRAAWADKAWNAEEKVPGPHNAIECPICMESKADVVLSCCTAAYCWDCLQPWIDQNTRYQDPAHDSITCPSCRAALDYKALHVVQSSNSVVMIE